MILYRLVSMILVTDRTLLVSYAIAGIQKRTIQFLWFLYGVREYYSKSEIEESSIHCEHVCFRGDILHRFRRL
jgi:hypothetical protein